MVDLEKAQMAILRFLTYIDGVCLTLRSKNDFEETFNLHDLMKETFRMVEPTANQNQIIFSYGFEDENQVIKPMHQLEEPVLLKVSKVVQQKQDRDNMLVTGNRTRIQQVCLNLLNQLICKSNWRRKVRATFRLD